MKKIWFYIVALAIGFVGLQSCSDDDDDNNVRVSAEIQESFLTRFPDAERVEWELKQQYYVAEFDVAGVEKDAWYNAAGEWVMTETDVRSVTDLPEAVQAALAASEYADWKVDDIDLYERPANDVFYLIEVEKKGQPEYKLYFRPDGTPIKAVPDAPNDDILPTTQL